MADEDKKGAEDQAPKPPEAPEKAEPPKPPEAAEPAKPPKPPDAAEPAKAAKPTEAPDQAEPPKPPDAAKPAKAVKPPAATEKAEPPKPPDAAKPAKAPKKPKASGKAEPAKAAKKPETSDATAGADEAAHAGAKADKSAGNGERRTLTDLADLADLGGGVTAEAPPPEPETPEPKLDAQGRAYATGKRKDAIARVWIKPGAGRITVNGRDWETYFARPVLRMIIGQPLAATERKGQYDVWCSVKGGGLSGQAGAVRHGISKALSSFEPDLRRLLKTGGFLTRDARVVERKKFGRHKARRSHQFSKR